MQPKYQLIGSMHVLNDDGIVRTVGLHQDCAKMRNDLVERIIIRAYRR